MTSRPHFDWRLRTRSLPLGERTLLLGIVNLTPDSFSDGGRFFSKENAVAHGLRLLDEGADVLDLGAESTRPNANPLSAVEEQERLLPALEAILRTRPEAIISIDTYHALTAAAALDRGAEIINDVSGLLWDERMAEVLAKYQPGSVLMHTRGRPTEWGGLPPLAPDEVAPLVSDGFTGILSRAKAAGIAQDSIVLDPGFGFGKLREENFVLLAKLPRLGGFDRPLLAGLSRKRFLTGGAPGPSASLERESSPLATEAATIAAGTAAILAGAHLLRVHDIAAARAAAQVADRLLLINPG